MRGSGRALVDPPGGDEDERERGSAEEEIQAPMKIFGIRGVPLATDTTIATLGLNA